LWLRPHLPQPLVRHGKDYEHRSAHELGDAPTHGPLRRAFTGWESLINAAIAGYVGLLRRGMRVRPPPLGAAVVLLVVVVAGLGLQLRREFFPEVDAGAFEMYVRTPTGTRIEETEKRVVEVERFVRATIGDDLETLISEIGVVADWSAAYTPNS